MEYGNIIVSKESNKAVITLNRPEVRNALNNQTRNEIEHAFSSLELDEEIHVIIFTGAGEKAFAAGADIRQLGERNFLDAFKGLGMSAVNRMIENSSKPTIVAINGHALGGGCELAMACDIRIAASHVNLGLPELNLGIIPGGGGTQRLARIVGKGRAMDMILTGEILTAEEAKEIGLISKVVSSDQLWNTVTEKANKIIAKGPIAVKMAKMAINKGYDIDMDTALAFERMASSIVFGSEDKNEGVQAFLEKRQANFKGK